MGDWSESCITLIQIRGKEKKKGQERYDHNFSLQMGRHFTYINLGTRAQKKRKKGREVKIEKRNHRERRREGSKKGAGDTAKKASTVRCVIKGKELDRLR